jgi:tRNA nucleotidyltransferase/poly(A) polymerase
MKFIKPRLISENSDFQIPNIIWKLNKIFNDNGHKLYVVGGAVRDFKTGDKPKDFDLCTDAMPEKVIEMLKPFYRVQLQGEAFGVVVVFTPTVPEGMEIATFREDVSKGRNPDVKLGVTIEDDVKRRDLTINALFYDLETKEIIDLVGGLDDLKKGIIRMVGDPMERIEEDALRILRVFRFASRYGSTIDNRTKQAIHRFNDISDVSMERIWDTENGEFMKSFKQAKDFQQYLDFLTEFKLWEQILPGIKVTPKIKNSDTMSLVLAQILKENDTGYLKTTLVQHCSISKVFVNTACFLIDLLDFDTNKVIEYCKNRKRFSVFNDDIKTWFKINYITDKDILKFTDFELSISANDVMKEFDIKPGPELGEKIKELEIQKFQSM